jgi:H2-forming N5,N10-methylenetetrahydromethanopterin dehydrogenase-like enzyme
LCILTLASLINSSNISAVSSSLQEQTIQNDKLNMLIEYFEENRDLLIPKLEEIRNLINLLININNR